MALPDFPQQGGCVCGAVRYRLTAPPLAVYRCHCKDCQRMSGAGYAMSMPVVVEDFEHLSGELKTYAKTADSGRVVRQHSCAHCATLVFNTPAAPGLAIVKAGTLDDPGWAVPVGDIWVGSMAPWVEIALGELAFPGQPPAREVFFAPWRALVEGGTPA